MAAASAGGVSHDLWPCEEARKLKQRVSGDEPSRPVVFESGFGPSGLPHLGTMGEVLRPAYVRRAFGTVCPQRPSRLIVFIDDVDGLRKVPESVPERESTARYLGHPVSRIPDPFRCCLSFADHMVMLLEKFLVPVEVDYELLRATEMYHGGRFDNGLELILGKHAEIRAIVAPTLREEHRAQWSPIMPLCPRCGQINATLVTAYHPERGTVEFSCERDFGGGRGCGLRAEQSIFGGLAKAQWKVDWALRWYVLGVDYELYGKDLIDSARISGQIVRLLGGRPPLGFPFEMFLDEQGHKVSKSVGRGVGVEQWTRYAPIEVLKYFLILNPRRARRLFLEAIPQYVDEYLDALRLWAASDEAARRASPLEFVLQQASARAFNSEVSFTMVMNLVGALGVDDSAFIRGYLERYDPALFGDRDTRSLAESLIDCALNFYRDFIEPTKKRRAPETPAERAQLKALRDYLLAEPEASAEAIEKKIYDLGREHYDRPGKIFPLLYGAVLGQERGPRLGTFIRLATPERVVQILDAALASG